jgi:hypothetical protein
MPNQAERPPARAGGFARGPPHSRGLRWPANPVAARPNQHNRSARRKRGQRGIYTPFISRAPAALLIAADCVVANDATLAESGPFCCQAMRLLRLPMLSRAPAPLGGGLATGAVRLGRPASACRRSLAPLKRPRSRDLWAARGRVLDTMKNRSTGRFLALVSQGPAPTGASGGRSTPPLAGR